MNRELIETVIHSLIDLIDALDTDADFEPDGDEDDGTFAEDEDAVRFRLLDATRDVA